MLEGRRERREEGCILLIPREASEIPGICFLFKPLRTCSSCVGAATLHLVLDMHSPIAAFLNDECCETESHSALTRPYESHHSCSKVSNARVLIALSTK